MNITILRIFGTTPHESGYRSYAVLDAASDLMVKRHVWDEQRRLGMPVGCTCDVDGGAVGIELFHRGPAPRGPATVKLVVAESGWFVGGVFSARGLLRVEHS